jgi:hypothetical protein
MRAFLRAGQYSRIEHLGRVLMRLRSPAGKAALEHLSRTDFFDLLLSDLAADSPERSDGALAALEAVAEPAQDRLVDVVRTAADYRLRHLAAEALGKSPGGGVRAVAALGPTTPEEEYENVVSVIDALGLEPELAEEEIVLAINHASERVRRSAVTVAYRMPESSGLGIIQRAINEGGTLGALRALHAIGELRLVEAMPIVQRQLVDTQDAAVVDAGSRALGRLAHDADTPRLRVVRLLGRVLERLPSLSDKEEAERAALTAVWALSQYDLPEAKALVERASSYPSTRVVASAGKALEHMRKARRARGEGQS